MGARHIVLSQRQYILATDAYHAATGRDLLADYRTFTWLYPVRDRRFGQKVLINKQWGGQVHEVVRTCESK